MLFHLGISVGVFFSVSIYLHRTRLMVEQAGGTLAGNETDRVYIQNVKAWHFLALFIVVFV